MTGSHRGRSSRAWSDGLIDATTTSLLGTVAEVETNEMAEVETELP